MSRFHIFMNADTPIHGIIFDLDGTLYRMKWYMKPLITVRLFPYCLRLPAYMKIRDAFAGKDLESGEMLINTMASLLARNSKLFSAQHMKQWIYSGFYRQFLGVLPLFRGARDGLEATLTALRIKGIKLAVLSDFEQVPERLARLKINAKLFDILAATELEGCLKPSTKPFLKIAAKWNIETKHILVIGDRLDTDGDAARAAGMQFLHISDKKQPPTGAYRWSDVRDYLEKLKSAI